jgi:hypothetical protein
MDFELDKLEASDVSEKKESQEQDSGRGPA